MDGDIPPSQNFNEKELEEILATEIDDFNSIANDFEIMNKDSRSNTQMNKKDNI